MRIVFGLMLLLPLTAMAADLVEPNHSLTPGAWNDPATPLEVLCQPGYAKTARHVSNAEKDKVFLEYWGYVPKGAEREKYEVDHLVPIAIDGKNTIDNLWPQSYDIALGAHQKDVLENTLHRMVCNGTISLTDAQHAIATDWVAAYKKFVLHQS